MTEKERMEADLIYDSTDKELVRGQNEDIRLLFEYNTLRNDQTERMEELLRLMFAEVGEGSYIQPPFYANFGGKHVHLGRYFYANFNLTLTDDGHIYFGDRVLCGPNVSFITATHPVEPSLRAKALQFNRDIHVGSNVWFGAGAIILPGVTIGDNTVIGAGSVVTKDIPANVVAVGNPCRILRPIGERDHEFFYKDCRIDWENMDYPGLRE